MSSLQHSRSGRGRSLSFFATDEDFQRWLAPLEATHCGYRFPKTKTGNRYREHQILMPLGDFMRTEFFEKDTFQFWVGPSEAGMDFSDEEFPSAACSLAGLILVRHRFFRMGRKDDSRIALVDKVVDERTGIVLANSENLPTYRSLLRRTRKDLVYEARYVDGQGQDCRPSGLRMTEAAAEAIARGEKYWVRPDLESARRRPAP